MRGWISIVAVSAVLSAGLVAGRAAADSVAAPAAPATWSDPPAKIAAKVAPKPVVAPPAKVEATTGPACTANAFASLASGCHAQGRAVRVIALSQR